MQMKKVSIPLAMVSLLTVTWFTAHASSGPTPSGVNDAGAALQVADTHEMWTRGKVVRVSAARGKITIEHEPIKNLDMMGMTMPFTAEDTALLDGLEAGDVIEFVAAMNGSDLILKNLRKPTS
jgi:Cu/Ag efflux protein CusF